MLLHKGVAYYQQKRALFGKIKKAKTFFQIFRESLENGVFLEEYAKRFFVFTWKNFIHWVAFFFLTGFAKEDIFNSFH